MGSRPGGAEKGAGGGGGSGDLSEREITVLVTGFGPFRSEYPVNPSWEIAQGLPEYLDPPSSTPNNPHGSYSTGTTPTPRIRILVHPAPIRVSYCVVRALIPKLWAGTATVEDSEADAVARLENTDARYYEEDGTQKPTRLPTAGEPKGPVVMERMGERLRPSKEVEGEAGWVVVNKHSLEDTLQAELGKGYVGGGAVMRRTGRARAKEEGFWYSTGGDDATAHPIPSLPTHLPTHRSPNLPPSRGAQPGQKIDFVLHIGMAGPEAVYSIERRGHRDGYRACDVDGVFLGDSDSEFDEGGDRGGGSRDGLDGGDKNKTKKKGDKKKHTGRRHSPDWIWRDVPNELFTSIDVTDVLKKWKREMDPPSLSAWDDDYEDGPLGEDGETGRKMQEQEQSPEQLRQQLEKQHHEDSPLQQHHGKQQHKRPCPPRLRISEDAGNYLCDFIYFSSLAELKLRKETRRVLFLHVPSDVSAAAVEGGRDVVVGLVRAVVGSWVEGGGVEGA